MLSRKNEAFLTPYEAFLYDYQRNLLNSLHERLWLRYIEKIVMIRKLQNPYPVFVPQ